MSSTHAADHALDHGHSHDDHHELGFWQKYVFSTDHKIIGIQYAFTGLSFLFLGFCLMMLMRWQLANPGQPVPFFGPLLQTIFTPFGSSVFSNDANGHPGMLTQDGYNTLGAMHGTIMVFFGVVPVAVAAFGNYVMPLQIGAPDMAFPKLNMASYWTFFVSCVIMMSSFFVHGGAAKSGWTSYPPLSVITDSGPGIDPFFNGQTIWLLGMVFNITGSLLGSINTIATIIQLRAPGLTWMRLPFFVWTQLVTGFLLLLAFPPLEAAGFMQLMDRAFGTSFFMPTGLMLSGHLTHWSGGGSPLLWQHLFWFLAHPEVYVLILPGIGMVAEIIANNTRKPLYGYKAMVGGIFVLGFLSFVVWAHHMYMTGMGAKVSGFFQTTTVMISIPSVILVTALLLSLWGGSIRFTVPMLFATAFLPMFGIGGLTGIPLAFNSTDLYLHDTYYVIGHFHYVVAPGTIFAIFAGVYYWYPKASGRMMNETLGRMHFWLSLIFINGIFFPMFLQGIAGVHRRWYDGGATYEQIIAPVLHWNNFMSVSAFLLGATQLIFIFNFFSSMFIGRKVKNDNPWDATTLEWDTPTPPPHGNFIKEIIVYRGPYEYSVPGADKDFTPQSEAPPKSDKAAAFPTTALAH
ncbi:MAG: cbb3-type cytochrome c oxidase subunit I [Chthoniobacter sp.]|uniref:cytochrome c oxidase subunit I n=1 Tax=Chthoniobacter sp. TaxID=2510640 RepID=UPI0032A30CC7